MGYRVERLRIGTEIINKNKLKEGLESLMEQLTDEDLNGNNGKEYTSKEAIEEGYKCDEDYFVACAYEESKDKLDVELAVAILTDKIADSSSYFGVSDCLVYPLDEEGNFVCTIVISETN